MHGILSISLVVAGGAVGWLSRTTAASPVSSERVIKVVAIPLVVPVPVSPLTPPPIAPSVSATALELQAEQADDLNAAAMLYRRAGDAFLREQDYPNATRCYRLFLARGGDPAFVLETSDSWLLVSLKNSAYKEKIDATKNDG
jgi:hypothetical protein